MATLAIGYGPRQRLLFDGDKAKHELWETMFLGFMRLHKLYDVILAEGEPDGENVARWGKCGQMGKMWGKCGHFS